MVLDHILYLQIFQADNVIALYDSRRKFIQLIFTLVSDLFLPSSNLNSSLFPIGAAFCFSRQLTL